MCQLTALRVVRKGPFRRVSNPCARSKSWWTAECTVHHEAFRACQRRMRALKRERDAVYRAEREGVPLDDGAAVVQRTTAGILALQAECELIQGRKRGAMRRAKRAFFDGQIARMDSRRIWDAVPWTQPRRQAANMALRAADGEPVVDPDGLAALLQEQFTPSEAHGVDSTFLDDMGTRAPLGRAGFSGTQVAEALRASSNSSAPGPDGVGWFWLKRIIRDDNARFNDDGTLACAAVPLLSRVAALFEACIRWRTFPALFKSSHTVVIPKPGKPDYSVPKAYRPIVLLNCIGKLMEKVLARQMQALAQAAGVMHPAQFGGTMQHSTTDAGVSLVHLVTEAWNQGMESAAVLVDVAQFYPSINHTMMCGILRRQGFSSFLVDFFEDYLRGRDTTFLFNGVRTSPAALRTGVGQGSALSPVLANLYLAPVIRVVEKELNDQFPGVTLQFYVDDGLIHVFSRKSEVPAHRTVAEVNAEKLEYAVAALTRTLARVGLSIEASKTELIYFRRGRKAWRTRPGDNPLGPPVTVHTPGCEAVVWPKSLVRYLGFFLDSKLTFRVHIKHYCVKACSTVTSLRMLGNSVRGMTPQDKRRLYIANVLPVMCYGAQLWWDPKWSRKKYAASEMQKAQSRAARWICGAFRTTPIGALDMFAGLLPIREQVNKLMHRACLRVHTLHLGHPLRAYLPEIWTPNVHNLDPQIYLRNRHRTRFDRGLMQGPVDLQPHRPPPRAHHRPSPLTWIHHTLPTCDERFNAISAIALPGSRPFDRFGDNGQLTLHFIRPEDRAAIPSKSTSDPAFVAWFNDVYAPAATAAMQDPLSLTLVTDGLARDAPRTAAAAPGAPVTTPRATGAAWAVWRPPAPSTPLVEGSRACGRVTVFDAEMIALNRGTSALFKEWLAWDSSPEAATQRARDDFSFTWNLFVDNLGAASSIFACRNGPSAMQSVLYHKNALP